MSGSGMHVRLLVFALTTLWGALLLFMLQPLVGRFLLPHFGGTPAVWISCLAFFQVALLSGYLWVHLLGGLASMRMQLLVQPLLALAALSLAPFQLPTPEAFADGTAPGWNIARYLTLHVGLPYVVLATTAPLMSRWYASARGREPFVLYAVSNAGSLCGLLAYPFLIEPNLDVSDQVRMLSLALWGYLLLSCLAAASVARAVPIGEGHARAVRADLPAAGRCLGWVLLSAAGSALLSSVSNHITTDVAAQPLLWVLPLALYLLTFVLAFGRVPYPRQLYAGLWIACTVALPLLILPGNQARLGVTLAIPLLSLFVGCMIAHALLARDRPSAEQLTAYYVCLSLGGALGGSFVGFVAPHVFSEHHELPLSMLAIHTLALVYALRLPRVRGAAPSGEQRLAWLGFGLALPVLCATMLAVQQGHGREGAIVARYRNFFGPLQVRDLSTMRVLTHGRTQHGMQLRDPALAALPAGYFGPHTGVGRALSLHAQGTPRALAVLGLGVGTLAAYAQPDDTLTFYEINPDMEHAARHHFSYLTAAKGTVSVVIADGRLALERVPAGQLDVLVLDAFSSDSVPTHLLTREAFAAYARALAPGGLLLANVSNRHLRVERVVVESAQQNGLQGVVVESAAERSQGHSRVRWAMFGRQLRDVQALLTPQLKRVPVSAPLLFTDRRASLWALLRDQGP